MKNLQPCINACAASARASRAAAAECLQSPRTLEMGRLCLDNAALCEITFQVLSRHSAHLGDFCAINRHINYLCASQCAQWAPESETLAQCREVCLRCAAECAQIADQAHVTSWEANLSAWGTPTLLHRNGDCQP